MFDELLNSSDLSSFITGKSDEISIFCGSRYDQVRKEKELINKFVLEKLQAIQSLDYSNGQNRAFLLLLYDLCERLEDSESMQQIYHTLKQNQIAIGARLLAANSFSFEVAFPHELIDQFDGICENLVFAIENEEDDDRKVVATFANYYIAVLGRQTKWITQLRSKIFQSIDKYSFLSSEFISKLLAFDFSSFHKCNDNIQRLKDELFGRIEVSHKPIVEGFLIEEGEYANKVSSINNITFQDLRKIAIENIYGHLELGNRGVKPLTSEEEMFIYLRNYGNMHYAKMISALEIIPLNVFEKEIEIVDWGCGQAIATVSLFEYLKRKSVNTKPKVTLIEPSEIALKRASLHCKVFNPSSQVKTVCKYFDELEVNDISTKSDYIKIHLFSNVIDIELFSMSNLVELMSSTQKGINYFVCVSPYINDIKADRVDSFKRFFEKKNESSFELIGSMQNTNGGGDEYWNCNNKYNGNFNGIYCDHPHIWCGCQKQWTRVARIFKVNL